MSIVRAMGPVDAVAFARDGFVLAEGLIESDRLEGLRERFDRLFRGVFETGIAPDEVNWQAADGDPTLTRQICNGWKADRLIAEIGSTVTKLTAVAGLESPATAGGRVRFLAQGAAPSTVAEGDVTLGLERAREDLEARIGMDTRGVPLAAASSAAGGLRMSVHGLTAQIVYPNVVGFTGSGVLAIDDEGLRDFCVGAYNDACGEMQAEGNGRLYPMAVLPVWDVKAAVKELARSQDELGLKGFVMYRSAPAAMPRPRAESCPLAVSRMTWMSRRSGSPLMTSHTS